MQNGGWRLWKCFRCPPSLWSGYLNINNASLTQLIFNTNGLKSQIKSILPDVPLLASDISLPTIISLHWALVTGGIVLLMCVWVCLKAHRPHLYWSGLPTTYQYPSIKPNDDKWIHELVKRDRKGTFDSLDRWAVVSLGLIFKDWWGKN